MDIWSFIKSKFKGNTDDLGKYVERTKKNSGMKNEGAHEDDEIITVMDEEQINLSLNM
jgi:hypothetical protein